MSGRKYIHFSLYVVELRQNFGILLVKGDYSMDQKKIGLFLKQLRKEQNLTQQQLAEQ